MDSEAIKREIVDLWAFTHRTLRDSRLQIGRLVRRFIVARLLERPESPRLEKYAGVVGTRSAAVAEVVDVLGVDAVRLNWMVAAAWVVDTLGGEAGAMSWGAVRAFAVLARRTRDGDAWSLKDGVDSGAAADVFRRAATEGWEASRVMAACREMVPKQERTVKGERRVTTEACFKEESCPAEDSLAVARVASPRDLADKILQMIAASPDAELVRGLVLGGLKRGKTG
jgi:hypothetical protein